MLRQEWDVAASYDRTGTPIHASYLPARLRWLRRTQPHVVRQVARWITFAEYACERLFGRPGGLGLSLAAWSGMAEPTGTGPGTLPPWARSTSIPIRWVPSTRRARRYAVLPIPGGNAGLPSPTYRGFRPSADGLCSNLGTFPGESDAIVFNIGTSAAVRALVPGPVRSVARRPLGIPRRSLTLAPRRRPKATAGNVAALAARSPARRAWR